MDKSKMLCFFGPLGIILYCGHVWLI